MHILDYIILGILAIGVIGAVRHIRKKGSCCGCSGNCGDCKKEKNKRYTASDCRKTLGAAQTCLLFVKSKTKNFY